MKRFSFDEWEQVNNSRSDSMDQTRARRAADESPSTASYSTYQSSRLHYPPRRYWTSQHADQKAIEAAPYDETAQEFGYSDGYWWHANRRYDDFYTRVYPAAASAHESKQEMHSGEIDLEQLYNPEDAVWDSWKDEDIEQWNGGGEWKSGPGADTSQHADEWGNEDAEQDGDWSSWSAEDPLLWAAPVIELVVRVVADYEARDDTELSIREGELVHVLRQDPSGWWEGYREIDGATGWFPSNFAHAKHEMWTIDESEDEGDAFPSTILP